MNRTTVIAVAVFAALLAVVLLTREDKVSEGVPTFTWKAPPQEHVTKVELAGSHRALLVKGAAGWTVANPEKPDVAYAADEALVTSLLGSLGEVKAADHVTSRAERAAELELDEAKGLKVTVSGASGVLGTLVFGKPAKAGGRYVKVDGAADVFATTARLGYLARRDVSGWRKKAILAVKAEELVSLEVKQEASRLGLVMKDGAWALDAAPPAGFRFDPAAAQRLVQQLATLTAQDFGTDPAVVTDRAQLVATTKDGTSLVVSLGAEANGTVPVRVEGDAQVYLVSAGLAGQLTKRLEDLRDLSLWAFAPEKVQRVAWTAAGKKTVLAKEGGAWKVLEPKALPAGFDFDAGLVDGLLARLKGLRALRHDASAAAQAACRRPVSASVEVELEGGEKRQLKLLGELGANEVCGVGSADALTYAVAKTDRAWLERGVELVKRLPAPSFPQGGGIQGLEQLPPDVRAKLEAQLRQQQLLAPPPQPPPAP